MPNILHIETSTLVCSVALSGDTEMKCHFENYEGPSHASVLGVFVQKAVDFVREKGMKLDAVAVSAGPGSYTGLRIGVSEAKGLCFGLDIPLIALDTLKIMACGVLFRNFYDEDVLYCPMIDARRMEVYTAVYDTAFNEIRPITAQVVEENTFDDLLESHQVLFFGNGAEKCKSLIQHPNARFLAHVHPLAMDMQALADKAYKEGDFADVAYFEPFYLKDFVATKPKNKVF